MTKKTGVKKRAVSGKAEKTIVRTLYGKGDKVTELSINLFGEDAAKRYCQNTNALQLRGGKWTHAAIVEEGDKIIIKRPPSAGKDITLLNHLDDRGIQKTLRTLDAFTLCLALKNAPKAVRDKVFRNMSKQAAEMLQEDLDYMGPVKASRVRAAQNDIAAIVDTLALNGEIEIIDEYFV
ncbi:MAG: hypothetical protein LBG57_05890 [Treponema sp.]|jgi:hypothetical protein|nr:hypothetical protein [Treponema sp.]